MATPKTGRPVGRPPDPHASDRIVAIAWEMFLARGVDATSIEAISARAGVSKATLYKHYPDKAALFEAGVAREMQMIEAAQNLGGERAGETGLEGRLRAFGLGVMGFLVSDHAVEFYNSLSGELRRNAKLARSFYDLGPGRTRANLAALLDEAARRGELRLDDSGQAAEHLFGLWQGFSNFQLSLGVDSEPIRTRLVERVEAGVAVFLRAYRPS